jgi:hypothetical protein
VRGTAVHAGVGGVKAAVKRDDRHIVARIDVPLSRRIGKSLNGWA